MASSIEGASGTKPSGLPSGVSAKAIAKRETAQRRSHENAMRPALPERFAAANEEDDQDLRRHRFDEPRGVKDFRRRMKPVQQDHEGSNIEHATTAAP